jgi:hypothetical protein
MKPSDIHKGATYRNCGAGLTTRKVIDIDNKHRPEWNGKGEPPDEPGVLFETKGRSARIKSQSLYLSSFASWAGAEIA